MKKTWMIAARFIGIGWYIGLCIIGGVLLGRWVGQKLEIEALGILLGLAAGIVLAVYGVYAGYSLLNRNSGEEDEQERR